jgi:hypothetical protein
MKTTRPFHFNSRLSFLLLSQPRFRIPVLPQTPARVNALLTRIDPPKLGQLQQLDGEGTATSDPDMNLIRKGLLAPC